MKLISFPEKKAVEETVEVNEELVQMFETLLEMAKTGHVQSAAVALVYNDGNTGNCFPSYNPTLTLGEMRAMEREILDFYIDGRLHSAGEEY